MRSLKLFNRVNQSINQQFSEGVSLGINQNQLPFVIQADQDINFDRPLYHLDGTSSNITVTVKDGSQSLYNAATFVRTDMSGTTIILIPEIASQKIGGESFWEIFPGESYNLKFNGETFDVI